MNNVLNKKGCSHIRIPNSDNGEQFRNRKGFFSINVQPVCTSNFVIINLVARQVITYNIAYVLFFLEFYEHKLFSFLKKII